MNYIENPKTKGSGIICAIPQKGICPVGCSDCFFQSGRSYLEPLDKNLPNMPEPKFFEVVRVNDGNDSNNHQEEVINDTKNYKMKFYNTSIPKNLDKFDAPVVLTLNPNKQTDVSWHKLELIPKNLMFVRFRTNTWNLKLCDEAIEYYSKNEIPIVLTFMAYYGMDIPEGERNNYMFRKRTLNSYNAITTDAWKNIMDKYRENVWVYSCGKIEGERGKTGCKYCGNCLRQYFTTMEKL
jgi:hypothetical protein